MGEDAVTHLLLKAPDQSESDLEASEFCVEFCSDGPNPKFVLGRNIYSRCIEENINVDGFIDDYTSDTTYLGRPVVKLSDVPKNALVLNVAGGRPLSAESRLSQAGLRNLDYFSFYRMSGLPLVEMRFNEGFQHEFRDNRKEYEWIYGVLEDELSKEVFKKLVSFRFDYNMAHLSGFSWREDVQYFEDFLSLGDGEVFFDVGGYDGFTSLEFIRRSPNYSSIHIFEPESSNYQRCVENLKNYDNIYIHNLGLSDKKANMKLDVSGSGSRLSEEGTSVISVDKLDSLDVEAPTFIKIDIEGEEVAAIEGGGLTIKEHHPKLAVSVYHRPGDFWRIPRLIFSIRDDYKVYMRHYTECIYETVMFFLPK